MLLLSTLLYLVGDPSGANSHSLALDELYINKFGTAAQSEGYVLFSAISGLNLPLYLYSFQSNRLQELDDGRINVRLPYVLASKQGFMLLNRVGNLSLYYLSFEGNYEKTLRLNNLLSQGERVLYAVNAPGGILLSLRAGNKASAALLDPETLRLKRLSSLETDFKVIWVAQGQRFWRFTCETGELLELDSALNKKAVAFRAIEPVENKGDGRNPYFSILHQPVISSEMISFVHLEVRNKLGELLETRGSNALLLDRDGKARTAAMMVLGSYQGATLSLDCENLELKLRK